MQKMVQLKRGEYAIANANDRFCKSEIVTLQLIYCDTANQATF